MENIFAEMPELEALLGTFTFVPALMVVIAGIALAFWGTRLFKICITFVGTVFFGIIGADMVAPLVLNAIGEAALEMPFSIAAIIGFAFAGLGYLLSYKLYRFAIFLFGGAIGYTLGTYVAVMLAETLEGEFFASEMFPMIVSASCAILVGIITLFIFKFLYIFSTSFAGMCTACMAAALTIAPGTISFIIFGIIGIVLSIVAMVYQYKNSEDM